MSLRTGFEFTVDGLIPLAILALCSAFAYVTSHLSFLLQPSVTMPLLPLWIPPLVCSLGHRKVTDTEGGCCCEEPDRVGLWSNGEDCSS